MAGRARQSVQRSGEVHGALPPPDLRQARDRRHGRGPEGVHEAVHDPDQPAGDRGRGADRVHLQRESAVSAAGQDRLDVWVVERGNRARFVLEALPRFRISRQRQADDDLVRANPGASLAMTRVNRLALHAVTFAALTFWSWRKWADPLVDFGRELYVPWQITRGKMLSRDIASLFGPLSPYINALWFRLFGVSLITLADVHLAVLCLAVAGIYHLLRVSTNRVTAT